jgi:hypothetical protein
MRFAPVSSRRDFSPRATMTRFHFALCTNRSPFLSRLDHVGDIVWTKVHTTIMGPHPEMELGRLAPERPREYDAA